MGWLKRAVQQDYPPALFVLSRILDPRFEPSIFQGVPKDEKQAAAFALRGAEMGSLFAMATISADYATGKGVPQDPIAALMWHELMFTYARTFQSERDPIEKDYPQRIVKLGLTPNQVAEAHQHAQQFILDHR
jgi:hypothetical protein